MKGSAQRETHKAGLVDTDIDWGRPRCTLAHVHQVFRRWLGAEYDLAAINTVLAAAAVERLDGDPLWLLLISGSGNAKAETVQALGGVGATITSTITSDGATVRLAQTRLPSRVRGRQALERRIRSLLLAVERFGRYRAYCAKDRLWSARVVDELSAMLGAGANNSATLDHRETIEMRF